MEEDLFYQHIMTARQSSQLPSFEAEDPRARRYSHGSRRGSAVSGKGIPMDEDPPLYDSVSVSHTADIEEHLPDYSTSIALEGVFAMKHEIEDTTKRAEDRHWHNVYVTLTGTALNIYHIKKDWGLGRTKDGPSICPDNPPWVKKSKLERSYSLHHADAGIAADYKKRRHVIRIRAESDQFLLSCIELTTFVKWLECLFAAIDISAPLDERDFPRDMSIPRIQRLRWFRGESPAHIPWSMADFQQQPEEGNDDTTADANVPEPTRRRSLSSPPSPSLARRIIAEVAEVAAQEGTLGDPDEAVIDGGDEDVGPEAPPPHINTVHRLSTTSYPNLDVDPYSGKWLPEHPWSSSHDLLYARLCYSNLLFRSPRKSNYIINKGKEWFVDWATGRMVRVLPPGYADTEYFFGPWQVVHTENRRI